jgi:hypothetical protein
MTDRDEPTRAPMFEWSVNTFKGTGSPDRFQILKKNHSSRSKQGTRGWFLNIVGPRLILH